MSDALPVNSGRKTVHERLWAKADCSDPEGCWLWSGAVNNKGYGLACRPAGAGGLTRTQRRVYAHRYAWEEVNGPIPEGLLVDHVCHERRCINPAHLRLVTPRQNQENRAGAAANSKTGHRNVHRAPHGFVVQVRHDHIGSFRTLDAAVAAAVEYRRQHMPFSEMDKAS